MIIDTHCHLTQLTRSQVNEELDQNVLYLTMGTSAKDWSQLLDLCRAYPNIYAALGLHPWFVSDNYQQQLQQLAHLINQHLADKHVIAVGEIGLDFSDSYKVNRSQQLDAFEQQLALAEQFQLPVSLHVYKAHNEVISLLKRYGVRGVVHSLGSSLQIAQNYADLGFKFGVNAILNRSNASRYHAMVQHFGIEQLVLETDAPNIRLPDSEQAHLTDINAVIEVICQLTGLSKSHVIDHTTANAQTIFNFRNK